MGQSHRGLRCEDCDSNTLHVRWSDKGIAFLICIGLVLTASAGLHAYEEAGQLMVILAPVFLWYCALTASRPYHCQKCGRPNYSLSINLWIYSALIFVAFIGLSASIAEMMLQK